MQNIVYSCTTYVIISDFKSNGKICGDRGRKCKKREESKTNTIFENIFLQVLYAAKKAFERTKVRAAPVPMAAIEGGRGLDLN